VAAGRARRAAARAGADPSAAERLAARIEDLDRTRAAALSQLSLARVVQNADAFLIDELGRGRAVFGEWRAAWNELLGVGRGDKIRPHPPALAEAKLKALTAIGRVLHNLSDHNARRAEGETRMKRAAAGIAKG
jgi:hypothetical protein